MNLFFFQAEDGIRDLVRSRGLGDVYKRQQLRNKNIVVARKEANRIFYRIRNPQLLDLIGIMLSLIHI